MKNGMILILEQTNIALINAAKHFSDAIEVQLTVCTPSNESNKALNAIEPRSWSSRYGSGTYGTSSDNSTHTQRVRFQNDLSSVLNLYPPLVADGYIGSSTQAAIRQFQAQLGLSVDGQAGPITKQHLYNSIN